VCDCRFKGGGEAFALVADNKYTGACSDACLQRERGNGGNAPGHEVDPSANVSPTRGLESINAGALSAKPKAYDGQGSGAPNIGQVTCV
jgi:hypothetical protein